MGLTERWLALALGKTDKLLVRLCCTTGDMSYFAGQMIDSARSIKEKLRFFLFLKKRNFCIVDKACLGRNRSNPRTPQIYFKSSCVMLLHRTTCIAMNREYL
jgi:hypothetical protein